jgi:hypothetical protein
MRMSKGGTGHVLGPRSPGSTSPFLTTASMLMPAVQQRSYSSRSIDVCGHRLPGLANGLWYAHGVQTKSHVGKARLRLHRHATSLLLIGLGDPGQQVSRRAGPHLNNHRFLINIPVAEDQTKIP